MICNAFRLITSNLLLTGLLLGLVCVGFSAVPVHAAGMPTPSRAVVAHDSQNGHATILVLDMSGSMSTNDLQGYRCSAADAYIDLSGQNDYIGLVGLDSNGSTTGSHNFQAAFNWSDPRSTATVQDKQALKKTIVDRSNNCQPDSTTPTYDALNQAFTMLFNVTKAQHISGSVILLTDGAPCPAIDDQVNAIESELLPKFKANDWPVDTIALGQDAPLDSTEACSPAGTLSGTYHDFLKGIAGGTGGKYYDDGQGPIAGISPLNIAGFFVDIFAHYSGETPSIAVGVQQLNGNNIQRNFPVVDGATKLDIVAVKESANVSFSLANPSSQPISANTAGVISSQDSFHVIYSITGPPPGEWIATAGGQGQFLLYSLTKTDITVQVDQVGVANSSLVSTGNQSIALPLGQNLEVTAHLESAGHPFSDPNYTLSGDIALNNPDCLNSSLGIALNTRTADSYTGSVKVPLSNKAGTYTVLICASTGSLQNIVASMSFNVTLAVFPLPTLYSAQTGQYTDTSDEPLNTTVVQWPMPLQWFYSIGGLDHLSGWPLQGHPAQPDTALSGEVQWNGQPYKGATIRATAVAVQSCTPGIPRQNNITGALPVTINQDDQGHFSAQFQPTGSEIYLLIFETRGTFGDSQGNFGPWGLCVNTNLRNATFTEDRTAGIVTFIYFLLLAVILSLAWFLATPRPFGQWVYDQGGSSERRRNFARVRRGNLLALIYKRNELTSREAQMPPGLVFRFRRGKHIDVCTGGRGSTNWRLPDGGLLSSRFQPVRELHYRSSNVAENDFNSFVHYTILNVNSQQTRPGGTNYGYSYSRGTGSYSANSGGGPSNNDYENYGHYPSFNRQRGRKGRVPSSSYNSSSTKKRKGRKSQSRSSWDDYDY